MFYAGNICFCSKFVIGCTCSLHICKPVSLLQTVVNLLGLIANGGRGTVIIIVAPSYLYSVIYQIFAFHNCRCAAVWVR